MDALPVSVEMEYIKESCLSHTRLTEGSNSTRLFRTIPPERVGLYGEYDHSGLAKRVSLTFSQSFEPGEIKNLRVTQRGAVVVLIGKVSSQRSLDRLVKVAMSVSGAVDVEVNGVSIAGVSIPAFRSSASKSAFSGLNDSSLGIQLSPLA